MLKQYPLISEYQFDAQNSSQTKFSFLLKRIKLAISFIEYSCSSILKSATDTETSKLETRVEANKANSGKLICIIKLNIDVGTKSGLLRVTVTTESPLFGTLFCHCVTSGGHEASRGASRPGGRATAFCINYAFLCPSGGVA
jgi:hypothetical protein